MTVESIAKTLGTGSGIDITALVSGLVEAQFASKTAVLDRRQETLTAQISAAAELKNAVAGFSAALNTLSRGGTLATQPTSSNATIVKASALSGGTMGAVNSTVEVRQIATPQVANTAAFADRTSAIGTGTLTLTFGTAAVENGAMSGFAAGGGQSIDIVIDDSNSSLDGIAAAINAKKAGVTASILSDGTGARLVLKGQTGESQAFTLEGSGGLSALSVGPGASGTTITTASQDAIVQVDGVELRRASNAINNIIDGVRLDLVSAQPGTVVTLGTQPPTAALTQAVDDFVATYNELQSIIKAATGPIGGVLRGDTAAGALQRQLREIVLAPLAPISGTSPTTLAEIGVATNRDGTLRIDAARLARVMASDPAAVEAMFASGKGLPAALGAVATAATDRTRGLGASESRYTSAQTDLADERARILDAAEVTRVRMTQQFASMDAKVAAYKSTQTFLTQQVEAWNAQRS